MSMSTFVRARRWAWAAVGVAVLAPRAPAQAVDPSGDDTRTAVEIRAGATRSDNVRRTPAAELEGTIWSAGLGLDVNRESRRLNLLVRGDLDWMDYPNETFDSDVLGYFDGLAVIAIAPDTFEWTFQETYGQLRADPFAAVTPDNLEDIHYFSTGPDLTLRAGSATSIRLSGRYSTTDSGVTALDGDRYNAGLALIRELSSGSSASLNASGVRVEFDNAAVSEDFDLHEAFARYAARSARTELSLDAGYTAIEQAQETSGGALARLSLARRLSPATLLEVRLGTQFSDAGDLFRYEVKQPNAAPAAGSVLGTSDPFENRFAALSWHYSANRTGFGVDGERSQERYENAVSLDRTRTTYAAYLERRIGRAVTLRAHARRVEHSFESGFDDKELQAGAALMWTIGRVLGLRLHYDRVDRDSSAAVTEFAENRLSLFVSWLPLARR